MVIQSASKKLNNSLELKIDGVVLSQATHCKFLGITIDESLSWKQQVSSINSKISRALFAIKQLKFSLPKESLLTLYFSLLHPYLTYGILAWGNASTNILRKTETLHKRALRTVHNKSYNSHTDPLFKQSGILRVSDLYQLEVVLFMYDYVRTKLPLSFRNIFKFNCDVYDAYITRRAQMFHIPKTKSRFVDKLPLYNFPSMWNNWCTQLNVNSSRGALKNSMKTILMNDYATLVKCENPRCIDCQLIT